MRKFVLIFCLFCGLFVFIIGSIRLLWISTAPYFLKHDFLSSDIHTVVLGASTGEFAWNDQLVPHSINFCDSGTKFASCYNKLKWITEYNQEQIDTVLLCGCIISFTSHTDNVVDIAREERDCILDYNSYFSQFYNTSAYWLNFFTSFPALNLNLTKFRGGYGYLIRDKLDDPNLYNHVYSIIKFVGGKNGLTEQFYRDNCKYQIYYLRKIRDYCRLHNKTLIILCTPLYKIPDMIDYTGYHQLIRNELGDSALIADYSRFEFPDTTCYGDLEHLNYRGAEFFSRHIAKNGLELKYAIDYCR